LQLSRSFPSNAGLGNNPTDPTDRDACSTPLPRAAPHEKSRGFRLVPRQRTQARHANDIDEYLALQQTGGRVAAVNPILTTRKNNVL
jgi:hypothetical protein